ncbi:MAG: helix-turn-helix transcriptional regulator [Pseudomonadota bacterium]|nr:helix-turn-helix transcriptional regulator [Pseudomonadota bacterium]
MGRMRKLDKTELRELRAAVLKKAAEGQLDFPEGIKQMRLATGLSQVKFAKMLGLTTKTIADIEAGAANPTVETLDKIGRPFGLTTGFVPRPRKSRTSSVERTFPDKLPPMTADEMAR